MSKMMRDPPEQGGKEQDAEEEPKGKHHGKVKNMAARNNEMQSMQSKHRSHLGMGLGIARLPPLWKMQA